MDYQKLLIGTLLTSSSRAINWHWLSTGKPPHWRRINWWSVWRQIQPPNWQKRRWCLPLLRAINHVRGMAHQHRHERLSWKHPTVGAGHRLLAAKQICKMNIIPTEMIREHATMRYADEADVLNIVMFGMTAKQWWEQNPEKKFDSRLCQHQRCLFAYIEYGKPQRCVYQWWNASVWATDKAQSDCHSVNEDSWGYRRQKPVVVEINAFIC